MVGLHRAGGRLPRPKVFHQVPPPPAPHHRHRPVQGLQKPVHRQAVPYRQPQPLIAQPGEGVATPHREARAAQVGPYGGGSGEADEDEGTFGGLDDAQAVGGELFETRDEMVPVGGDPVRRVGRLGECLAPDTGLRRREGRRGDRPQRLGPLQVGDRLGGREDVADPQPRQPPRLREAPQHHQTGHVLTPGEGLSLTRHRVHESLVHHQRPPGTGETRDPGGRVEHRRRIGRVADHDEVGVLGDGRRIEPEAVLRPQEHPVHGVPGVPQCRLRLRELRVHHDGTTDLQGAGEQHEGLRGTRREEHVLHGQPVPGGHRRPRGAPVRVGGETGQRFGDALAQPRRRRTGADVHREVDERRAVVADLGIPVVTEVVRLALSAHGYV